MAREPDPVSPACSTEVERAEHDQTRRHHAARQDHVAAFHVMAKPTGARCNLHCDYCFFLEKEKLYAGSDLRMRDEVMEAYVAQTVEAQRVPHVTIAWQGGEPTLMGLDFYRRARAVEDAHVPPV